MSNISTFLRGVKGELSYIQWPTRREAVAYTAIVIVISLLVAGYLGALDAIFIRLFDPFLT
jgi:preprotein translocase subunit SecE